MEPPYTQQMAKQKIKEEGKKLKDTLKSFIVLFIYGG